MIRNLDYSYNIIRPVLPTLTRQLTSPISQAARVFFKTCQNQGLCSSIALSRPTTRFYSITSKTVQKKLKAIEKKHSSAPPLTYQTLVKHLPECIRNYSETFMPSAAEIELYEKFTEANSLSEIGEENLRIVSQVALFKLRTGQVNLSETATIHLIIGAIKEFILHPKLLIQDETYNGEHQTIEAEYYVEYLRNIFPNRMIKDTLKWVRYDEDPIFDSKKAICATEKIKSVGQQYFALNDEAWKLFCEEIEKNPSPLEKRIYLFPLPKKNAYSAIDSNLHRILNCLQQTEMYCILKQNKFFTKKFFAVPSFSLQQCFLNVINKINQRAFIELTPILGSLSAQDVAKLKKSGSSPLGLYCPDPLEKGSIPQEELTDAFMWNIDGYEGGGPAIFSKHDLYHALRECIIKVSETQARFYLCDLLDIKNNPYIFFEDQVVIEELKNLLIDGQLYSSFKDQGLFQKGNEAEEPFGHIFHYNSMRDAWNERLIKIVIDDMLEQAMLWSIRFNLSQKDLIEPEKTLYQSLLEQRLSFKYDNRINQMQIMHKKSQPINSLCQKFLKIRESFVYLIDATIDILECNHAVLVNCKINTIKASGSISIQGGEIGSIFCKETVHLDSIYKTRIQTKDLIFKHANFLKDVYCMRHAFLIAEDTLTIKNLTCQKLYVCSPTVSSLQTEKSKISEIIYADDKNIAE